MTSIPSVSRGRRARSPTLPSATLKQAVYRAVPHKGRAAAIIERLELLLRRRPLRRDTPTRALLLADIDAAVAEEDAFQFVLERLAPARDKPDVGEVLTALLTLADAAVPLATAMAQRFGPLVEERLRARKRSAGHYDYEDMLALVAEALHGPQGGDLAAALRARYRLAIIDEFQDTDPVQWEIFRTIFLDGPGARPLYVVGDPKQSIYGFRGADVNTYTDACRAIGPASAQVALDRNFRSTGAVIDAFNALLDQGAPLPFFSAGAGYAHPVRPGGKVGAGAGDSGPPLSLLRVNGESEDKLPMRVVRTTLARAIADEIAALLASPDAPPPHEVFVLTRIRKESQTIAAALAARGVPAVVYGQEGLYETDEAREVRDLLRAIADPHDPGKRLRAWLTPFFALPITELPAAAAGVDQPLRDRLVGVARRRAEPRPGRPVRPHPGRQRRRPARAGRGRQPAPADQLPAPVRGAGRRGGTLRRRRRRAGAPAGGAGGAADRPRARRGQPAARRGRSRRGSDHDHARGQGAGGRRRLRLRRLRSSAHATR